MTRYDVVIAGGGPAGSTVAALVKKYAPDLSVLLLEKAHFPRHHVGESMLAGASPVLQEMGAYEKVNRHGFIEKVGATYIWGQDRQPWGFSFNEILAQAVERGLQLPETYAKAWQVRREEYDEILLRHAAEMGAEVREGAQVRRPIIDSGLDRVIGVVYTDDRGSHEARCHLFLDCTGQDALLGHVFNLRRYDEQMNNYALYGYWRGAAWRHEYLGYPSLARIFIATSPRGWIWYIPISKEVMSVGFVTNRATLQGMHEGPESLYRSELQACPEIWDLLETGELVRHSPRQPRDVMAVQDWSYTSRQMAGAGWALCGDAAGFVDPILSSGAMLAHELGQKAAYTINTAFRASTDRQIEAYWAFYQETYRTNLQAYRDMAAFWYSNNFSMASWWWQAQRTLNTDRAEKGSLTDRDAFVRVAAGYANRAESLSLFGSYPLGEALKLTDGLFGSSATFDERVAIQQRYRHRRLRLHPKARLDTGMYYYQGLIRNTRRIVAPDGKRYLDLHPGEDVLVNLLDGRHHLAEIEGVAERMRSLQQRLPVRTGAELVVQLGDIGALI